MTEAKAAGSKAAKATAHASVQQFENLKTLLKNAKSSKGGDLYTHI